jgi:hypothetical protein
MAAPPVTIVEEAVYASARPRAHKLIGQRDPDDVDVLALVLHLGLPLWSNDNDFEETGIEWYTTAELLRIPKRIDDDESMNQKNGVRRSVKAPKRVVCCLKPVIDRVLPEQVGGAINISSNYSLQRHCIGSTFTACCAGT